MYKILSLITLVFITFTSFSQDYTIRGFIYDKSNGEPMSFEKIKVLKLDSTIIAGAVTDLNGFFSIPKLEKGIFLLKVENFKYEIAIQKVEIKEGKKIYDIKFELIKKEAVKEFDEIKISADNKTKRTEIEISKLKLDKASLERIPSYGAENDIVGAFSVTPGVVTTGDQGGQLYVRGGTPIQNKVLLDGMTVYNPFH